MSAPLAHPTPPKGEDPAPPPLERVSQALERARGALLRSQRADGSWDSPGQAGPWVTAQVAVALARLGALAPEDGREAARWLSAQQRRDGSFALHPCAAVGHLGTTASAWAALHVADPAGRSEEIARARAFVGRQGGTSAVVQALSTGDLAAVYLALAGLLDPADLPVPSVGPLLLPPVLDFLRTRFHSGVFQLAFELAVLVRSLRGDFGRDGRAQGPWGALICRKLVELLRPFQNPDGSWNDSSVLSVLALPALAATGLPEAEAMKERGLRWLLGQGVRDARGLRFDGFGTEVWSTAFDLRALMASGLPPRHPALSRALGWLSGAQSQEPMPRVDDRRRGAPLAGGWPFQKSNPTMPDCDDSAVALTALGLALQASGPDAPDEALRGRLKAAADAGQRWLLGMQNPDGGWSAFVWGLPGKRPGPTLTSAPKVPLDDPLALLGLVLDPPASMGDPSTEDVTARVLYGLGCLGRSCAEAGIARAVEFLRVQQCESGAWWGRWVVNYLSATAFVLMGLRAVGVDMQLPWVRRAVAWVGAHQNADGGFGEGPESYRDERLAGVGESMAPLTGLVVQGLLSAGELDGPVVRRAVGYLLKAQCSDGSWPNGSYLHTNVPPDTFYLYTEPALFYPTEALGRYRSSRRGELMPVRASRWTDALLSSMRRVADPVADDVVQEIHAHGDLAAVNALLAAVFRSDDPIPRGLPERALRYFDETASLPPWAEPSKLALGQALFTRAGWSVAMGLFCSSLPQAYAAARGARVLTRTQGMTRHVRQRIFETAQFLFDVLDEGALGPGGRGVRVAQKVRLMHAGVRSLLLAGGAPSWRTGEDGLPINQEDLAGTLMTFSAVILEALARLDVAVAPDEAEAWIHTWTVVGHLLGVREELMPRSVPEADQLMDAIRARQWAPSVEGRMLVEPLIGMMQGYLPGLLGRLPVALVRHLAGDHCADLLGLPSADWPHLFNDAAELPGALAGPPGHDLRGWLVEHFTHLLMEAVVSAEREGKQARFRIPAALKRTVDPRL